MDITKITLLKQQVETVNQNSLAANAKIEFAKSRIEDILKKHSVNSIEELESLADAKRAELAKLASAAQEFVTKRSNELGEIAESLGAV